MAKGVLSHIPPKFEHICSCHSFFPLSSVQILLYQLVAYCVCFKMICEMSLYAPFLRRYIQIRKGHSKNSTSQIGTRIIQMRLELQTKKIVLWLA